MFSRSYRGSVRTDPNGRTGIVPLIIAILLLAVLLGVVGFAVHLLWVLAVIVLVIWLLGFVLRGSGRSTARWYRW
jgi:hypothetical protein